MRSVLVIVACGMLGSACVSGVAAEPGQVQIQSWLAQLDDDDFARREQASERLQAAGDAAIEALAQGAVSGNPEVAWRAGEALKRIAIEGNERTLDRVAAALQRIGQQKAGGMNRVVAEIRAQQRQIRRDRATAQIRRLGGQLSGGGEGVILGFGGFIPVAAPVPVVEIEIAEAAVEVAAEVEEVETLEDLPELPTDDLKAVIAEVFAADRAPRPAADEASADVAAALEDVDIFLGGVVDIVPVGAFGGADAIVEVDAGGGAVGSQSLALDANWRGGDKGLSALADLPEITQVSIHGAPLTDAALLHVAALPRLGSLHIQSTKFSAAALRKLHRARPKAYLFCQGEAMMGVQADPSGECVLTRVYPGSGAHDAGLRAGDKILAIDGLEIRDFSELTISVYARGVGEKLKIELARDGQRLSAEVELRARNVLEP